MYYLGIIYDRGFGVRPDPVQAAKWFEKGAARGDSLSAYHLGKMAETGRACRRTRLRPTCGWHCPRRKRPIERDAAYTQQEIRKLERSMTPEQIAKAKKLAAAWKPEK